MSSAADQIDPQQVREQARSSDGPMQANQMPTRRQVR